MHRPAPPENIQPSYHEYIGECVGGELDGKIVKQNTPYFSRLILDDTPENMDFATVPPLRAVLNVENYQFKNFYKDGKRYGFWVCNDLSDDVARQIIAGRYP
jgi:hypothetical protein